MPLPALVFARSRGLTRAVGLLAVLAVADTLAPRSLYPIPVRANIAISLGPLLAALPGVLLASCTERPEPEMEPTRAGRLVQARAAWLGTWLVCFTAVGILASGWSEFGLELSARSLAMTAGLTLIAAQMLPALAAWLPSALLLAVTLVYGTKSVAGEPYSLALLLKPIDSSVSAGVALVLIAVGSALYIARDARPI
jgi:hypothetical protein